MSRKVMRLVDPVNGLMVCKVCGAKHWASLQSGIDRADGVTNYYRGSWQCQNGCSLADPCESSATTTIQRIILNELETW